MTTKIPKKITTALVQSLGAGVVPRLGLEHIAVGRKLETEAILDDFDNKVSEGAGSFRIIVGRYGSGKSFLCQLARNYALQKNFVVADADLAPDRRFTGTQNQGLNLYRELLKNLSTRTRPEGNAFVAILERWISDVQNEVIKKTGITPSSPGFSAAVEERIRATISQMEGLVHGFDYATVISAYWTGYQQGDDERKNAALRWLKGEFSTKAEAREALGVRVIIDDDSWYDYIKLLANFVKDIGYKGLIIFLDEAVNLYKISNTVARKNNYEKLLTIFNDVLQGQAAYLGVVIGGTPQMVEDSQRGLFSYEALKSRLQESRFVREGLRDYSGPMIRLDTLRHEEIFVLLQNLQSIHALNYGYEARISDKQIQAFMNELLARAGTDQFLTPREVIREFIAVLNLLYQNPEQTFESIVKGSNFQVSNATYDPDALTPESEIHDQEEASPYRNFQI